MPFDVKYEAMGNISRGIVVGGDIHITLARRGGGGVPGLLTDANSGGRGGLGHVNVSKKPPRSMRTNCLCIKEDQSNLSPIFSRKPSALATSNFMS